MNNQSVASMKPLQTFPGHFLRTVTTVAPGTAHDNHRQPLSNVVEAAVTAKNGSRFEGGPERVALMNEKSDPIANQIHYEPKFYSRTKRKLEEKRLITKEDAKDKNINEPSSKQKRNEEAGLTALVSFPGSGNTWLRYLLQQSTGEV